MPWPLGKAGAAVWQPGSPVAVEGWGLGCRTAALAVQVAGKDWEVSGRGLSPGAEPRVEGAGLGQHQEDVPWAGTELSHGNGSWVIKPAVERQAQAGCGQCTDPGSFP